MKTSNKLLLGLLALICLSNLTFVLAFKANDVSVDERKLYQSEQFNDTGDLIQKSKSISPFTALAIRGIPQVKLSTEVKELQVWAPEIIHPMVVTENENGILKIRLEAKESVQLEGNLRLVIPVEERLSSINLDGVFELFNDSTLQFNELELSVSGSSIVNMTLNCNTLNLYQRGAINTAFTGTTDNFYIQTSGANNVRASEFQAKNITLSTFGATDVDVYATESLDVSASGSTDVQYKGDPSISTRNSGAFDIRKMN